MKDENEELTIEQEVTRDCPILFQMRYRPCTETCMCYGFECEEGWFDIIAEACRKLEAINAFVYPKYRVRIQADQIKSKYSTLRFYYSVTTDPNAVVTWIGHTFQHWHDWLNKYKRFDFKMKKVTDVEPYDYDETKELTKEQYDELTKPDHVKCSNVEYKEIDGKYIETIHLHNYGKFHSEPTRLKILWRIKECCRNMANFFLYRWPRKDSAIIRNVITFVDSIAQEIIQDVERRSEEICEKCGTHIGTEWSPTCMTTGWWTRLCDECAAAGNSNYIKNGELWNGDKMLMNKEDTAKKYHMDEI